jgi:DNA-binding IclR family transcriptional regulator
VVRHFRNGVSSLAIRQLICHQWGVNAGNELSGQVQSVRKVFRLIEALADEREMSVTGLARVCDLNKVATFRFLNTLRDLGYVEQNSANERYRLKLKLFEVGSKVTARIDEISEAQSVMRRLADETGETVHLAVMDEGDVVYVDKIDSTHILRMFSRIGNQAPCWCTGLGKALLAWLPERELKRVLGGRKLTRFTPNTITDLKSLKAELKKVASQGVAIDDEEHEPGIHCAAAPIRNRSGRVVAAVSLSWPGARHGPRRMKRYRELIGQAGAEISRRLGFS